MNNFKKIVLTGGPCAGKTKGVKFLKKELEKLGINVILINESAETLISDGISRENTFEFQKAIALNQLEKEKEAEVSASKVDNSVIICDRGLIDAKVYLSEKEYEKFKSEINLTEIQMRDRYDAAFHMESFTVANGYKNSDIRIESASLAFELNEKSLRAWCGNPHYRFIPSYESMEEKLGILLKEVKAFIGIPRPLEIEKKYLIRKPDFDFLLSRNCNKVEITQYYLSDNTCRFRVRSRGIGNDCVFTKTMKTKVSDGVYEEIEDIISADEFKIYIDTFNVDGEINKERYCLMENGMYYEIDIFPFWHRQAFLEVELSEENQKFSLPDYIEIIDDVTNNYKYKNSNLCKNIPPEKK